MRQEALVSSIVLSLKHRKQARQNGYDTEHTYISYNIQRPQHSCNAECRHNRMPLKYDIECRHVNKAIAKNERMSI